MLGFGLFMIMQA